MPAFPLVSHNSPDQALAWRHGAPITVAQFLLDVSRLAAALPAGRHVLNACADRYRFAVGLAAALVSERVSLLPPSHTAETVRQMKVFAPDAFCLADGPTAIDLPCLRFDDSTLPLAVTSDVARAAGQEIPRIPGDRVMAYVFTSGSTGAPVAHLKKWGNMVGDVRAERAALLVAPHEALHVLGTVPPQHMYGIESTVLLPLQSGGVLSGAHPFYPADICEALASLPRPR
ncbi:MAG: acyl-CoA synthetase, partial [Comamonadaceae bacterium]